MKTFVIKTFLLQYCVFRCRFDIPKKFIQDSQDDF